MASIRPSRSSSSGKFDRPDLLGYFAKLFPLLMPSVIGPIAENGEKYHGIEAEKFRTSYRSFNVHELERRLNVLINNHANGAELEYLKRVVSQLRAWGRARIECVVSQESIPRHGA